jgi:ABC-type polysaccharide/polyol phosphate transport system ATPase subunit
MHAIQVQAIRKNFRIPSVRRETVREHVMDFFRPHPSEILPVLQGVTFDVRDGETFGIMGRNGSGKSTLLKILTGIYQADSGEVQANTEITPILELGVGWNPELDAIDNIYLLGSVMGLSLTEIRASMDEILAFGELERFANLQLKHYSSGMASRLAYSVAFRAVRGILILDEIFAVGDVGFTQRCQARFREIRAAGHTVILVSHDPRTVTEFCDRALLLERGRVAFVGSGPDVANRYQALLTHNHPDAELATHSN